MRIAQRAIPTGLVYAQNEVSLGAVGAEGLQRMLLDRDWEALAAHRVDRTSSELYDTARRLVDEYAAAAPGEEGAPAVPSQPPLSGPPHLVATAAGAAKAPAVAAAPEAPTAAGRVEDMDIDDILAAMEALEAQRAA